MACPCWPASSTAHSAQAKCASRRWPPPSGTASCTCCGTHGAGSERGSVSVSAAAAPALASLLLGSRCCSALVRRCGIISADGRGKRQRQQHPNGSGCSAAEEQNRLPSSLFCWQRGKRQAGKPLPAAICCPSTRWRCAADSLFLHGHDLQAAGGRQGIASRPRMSSRALGRPAQLCRC